MKRGTEAPTLFELYLLNQQFPNTATRDFVCNHRVKTRFLLLCCASGNCDHCEFAVATCVTTAQINLRALESRAVFLPLSFGTVVGYHVLK